MTTNPGHADHCQSREPDWSNWDDYHGEPRRKPCNCPKEGHMEGVRVDGYSVTYGRGVVRVYRDAFDDGWVLKTGDWSLHFPDDPERHDEMIELATELAKRVDHYVALDAARQEYQQETDVWVIQQAQQLRAEGHACTDGTCEHVHA